jgi:hypothetical protein
MSPILIKCLDHSSTRDDIKSGNVERIRIIDHGIYTDPTETKIKSVNMVIM